MRALNVIAAVLALLVSFSRTAAAQETDPRWQPWLGCWKPTDTLPASLADDESDLVCVIPGDRYAAVVVATVSGGEIVSRDTIVPNGALLPTSRGTCAGWETAEWSARDSRVYLRSEHKCPGGLVRGAGGLLAIAENGDWLDVRGLTVGANRGVRVLRYAAVDPATPAGRLPAEITDGLQGRETESSSARLAAGRWLNNQDVIEASRRVDASVVETWLLETGHEFRVEAGDLVALADSGVAPSVTDLMVALSYPRSFAINRAARQAQRLPSGNDSPAETFPAGSGSIYSIWDPFGPWTYGYSGYGYSPGYIQGYGWYPGNNIIVVSAGGSEAPAESGGRVVKGRGYKRGSRDAESGSSSASTERPRTSGSGESSSASSSSPSSSGESSGSGDSSSGSGDSSGRTAKPRG